MPFHAGPPSPRREPSRIVSQAECHQLRAVAAGSICATIAEPTHPWAGSYTRSVGVRPQTLDEMTVVVGAATDTGTVRDKNEDAILIDTERARNGASENGMLLAVADGMGGYQRGEVASRIAIDTLGSEYYGA